MKKLFIVMIAGIFFIMGASIKNVEADVFSDLTGFDFDTEGLNVLEWNISGNVETVYKYTDIIGTTITYFGYYQLDPAIYTGFDGEVYLVLIKAISTPQTGETFVGFLDDLYITSYVDSYPSSNGVVLLNYSPQSDDITSNSYTVGMSLGSRTTVYAEEHIFTNAYMNVWNQSNTYYEKFATEWDYTLLTGWRSKTFFRTERSEYATFVVAVPSSVDVWYNRIQIYTRFSYGLDDSFWTSIDASKNYAVSYGYYYYDYDQ